MQLCEVGEIRYLTWTKNFRCSKMEGRKKALVKEIEETCKTMEDELEQWRKTINDRRHHCYSLNHFTMKQILNLREELAKACRGKVAMDELPLKTFLLLETVDRNIDPLVLANVLKTMIPDNSIFLTDDGFRDERKYFASDRVGESSVAESVEEQILLVQPEERKRKNSFETFTSARETLEGLGYGEEFILAALQDCGRQASEADLVAWVVSREYDEEAVVNMCEEAKKNPHLSDLLKDVFRLDCHDVNDKETVSGNATVFDR